MDKPLPKKVRLIVPKVLNFTPDFKDPDLTVEFKFDGYRALLFIDSYDAYFLSRSGKRLQQFQKLADGVRKELRCKKAILDGEIVAIDPDTFRCDFLQLRSNDLRKPILYLAFDLLWLDDEDWRGKPLVKRKAKLKRLIGTKGKRFVQFVWSQNKGRAIHMIEAMTRLGLEGLVIKRASELYTSSTRWLKYINPQYTRKQPLEL